MEKIVATIEKPRFDDVKEALPYAGIAWFSYYAVRGEDKMRRARIYRGVKYDTSSIERIPVNVVVRDKNVEKTIAATWQAVCTGETDAGCLFGDLLMPSGAFARVNAVPLRSLVPKTKHSCRAFLPTGE